ncbi:AMIN domain-containing protein [Aetokthonos hydrillicola Thurmond2011]|uniref:AMIN domain-containing protein n=2 Tax=Aetokthonos TaxID=1550243 RepID=A0AAP5I255_9CYAN|nr:type IV pilus secretin family protein [Aetokthonos hydrillicola]MBW4588081.1 AMIN domain-containing protein [Aetokthonos hydrillicola CCALA 1050]MDR9893396.1 AMIN domain-containing protein [Aetokthonos hydrillicola Thurmond2011]
MKQIHGNGLILGATATIFLAAQPAWAQMSLITDVQLQSVDGGISVILKTSSGNRPQVFTTQRGKSLVVDIINTQLRLSKSNSFRKDNPSPGIASVAIATLDTNSVRVIVTGAENAPSTQPVVRKEDGITLSFTSTAIGKKPTPQGAQAASAPKPTLPQTPPAPSQVSKKPDVLIPNPKVLIDGKPAPVGEPGQPVTFAPPLLPRAVAPPVGDIAISNLDASPTAIDLGTQERVPRLVLRDAPVREVLSLLARAAGLNLAYVGGNGKPSLAPTSSSASTTGDGPTISLDIENEPVQDVFNYVLRLSGLEANRNGRTVFVGANLPNASRSVVMRNLRLNQVTVGTALNFLVALGAESAITRERLVTSVNAVPVGGASNSAVTQTQTTTESKIETQRVDFQDSVPLLRGLQVSGDERTNSITLVGNSRLIDIAIAQLTNLDVRRRQVAVNIKVIDVNLLGTHDFNSSFSFGIGNNYFVNDGGAASMNFGGSRPATGSELAGSITSTPTIENPYGSAAPFYDPNNSVSIPGTTPGTTVVDANGNTRTTQNPGSGTFYKPISPIGNPLQPGFSDITPATDNIVTIDPTTGKAQVTQGILGTATAALPSLYQFPKRLLASLQAQVTNGNAKILTDPTLTVQEGQQAVVKLTAEVYGGLEISTQNTQTGANAASNSTRKPIIKDAGLTVAIKIERIDDNGFVSLSVAPTVSALSGTTSTPDGAISLLAQRSLQSGVIRLRDGQTLILSGIIQDSDRVSVSKFPILGDIPLLGSLFRKTSKTNQRNEVVVLLTPQIMDDSERSSFGYNYQPSPEVRRLIERRGLQVPSK